MNIDELLKKAAKKEGVEFRIEHGKRHMIIHYGKARTIAPRHRGKELKKGTVNGIKKQLGVKE